MKSKMQTWARWGACLFLLMIGATARAQAPRALEERIWVGDCEESGRPAGPLLSSSCDEPADLLDPVEQARASWEVGPFPVWDLSPWFGPAHPYHAAQAQVARGDCEGAVARLRPEVAACQGVCPGAAALRLLWGEALLCGGDKGEALAALEALARDGYPGMEPELYGALWRAQGALGKPRSSAPAPTLGQGAEAFLSGELRRARQEAQSGYLGAARGRLQRLQGQLREPAQVRRVAALEGELLEEAGQLEEAAQVTRAVWRRAPSSALGRQMIARLDALARRGAPNATLTLGERLDSASAALARAGKKERKALTQQIVAQHDLGADDQQALEALALGLALEQDRDREGALKALSRAAALAREPALLVRVKLAQGTALRRLHRDEEAIEVYLSVARALPRDRLAPEARYQAGRLLGYLGQHERARQEMAALVLHHPDAARVPDALWQGAWADWMRGDDASALRLLEHLERFHGLADDGAGQPYAVKARYWQARAHARLGDTPRALADLRLVTERHPLTYYAAMAQAWIKELGGDNAAAAPFQPRLSAPLHEAGLRDLARCQVPAHPRARRGLELWKTGRQQEAKAELLAQLQFKQTPRAVVEILATLHLEDGNLSRSHWIADRYSHFSVAPYDGNARLWGLAWPAPRRVTDLITPVAKDVGLNPWLPLAIIRHESAFQPSARSGVGAVGLMQIMPGTAQVIERLWYNAPAPGKKLQQPETNVRLGTTMLRMLDHYYQGNLPLMVAAYNAGTGVANRWWRDNKHLETDALLEQMTYPLTVAYTRKVIGSYYAYRVLYGDGTPPPIPLRPPQTLNDWGRPPQTQLLGLRAQP